MDDVQKPGDVYRERARREQKIADETTLANVRAVHAAAAARWITLAERADRMGVRAMRDGDV